MKHLAFLSIVLLAATVAGHAQLGVYAGYTNSKLDLANTPRLNGGTFGAYYDGSHHPLLNFGIDVRGSVLPSSETYKVTSITAGPRIVFHLPLIPLRPYAEGLVGGAHVRVGTGFATTDRTSFAGGVAVGADLHLLPYVDWRVLDYSYSRLQAGPTQQQSFTTGIVVRIPFS